MLSAKPSFPINMKAMLRNSGSGIYGMLKTFRDLILFDNSYLHQTGYYRSASTLSPCKVDGSPIPWMNYSIVKVLEEGLRKAKNVKLFEYGSGASTLFFANNVDKVYSLEHDVEWFNKVKAEVPENVEVFFQEEDKDGGYCRAISQTNTLFDVVVVDGRDRPNCVRQAINYLTERGVIILDDSHREGYQSVLKEIRDSGFRTLSIEGLKPLSKKAHSTTICYREGNCLGI